MTISKRLVLSRDNEGKQSEKVIDFDHPDVPTIPPEKGVNLKKMADSLVSKGVLTASEVE
jgi:hypothetical protein